MRLRDSGQSQFRHFRQHKHHAEGYEGPREAVLMLAYPSLTLPEAVKSGILAMFHAAGADSVIAAMSPRLRPIENLHLPTVA